MVAFPPPLIAKLLGATVLTGGLLLASSSGFASALPAPHAAAPSVPGAGTGLASKISATPLIERWTPLIKEASRKFGIAEDWIKAVMRVESGGRTVADDNRPITSKAGAMGLMQVMPQTYQDMRQQYGLGTDPYEPRNNVLAGAAYMRWLYDKYGYPKLFAAYNAGPGTVDAQSAGARQLPSETRAYVRNIALILGGEAPDSHSAKDAKPIETAVTLTRPNGETFSIEGPSVDSIRAALPDEYAPGVQTVVAIGKQRQGVTEDMATVASILKSHGGKFSQSSSAV
jgi:hypothetical protein